MELIMGENKKSFRFNLEETVPTYTIGAAFTLSVIMGVILVSGVLLKPYEAREVVESLHERILMEKEYRELSRIKYSPAKVAFSSVEGRAFPEGDVAPEPYYAITVPEATPSRPMAKKTDRAQSFDRDVKSDQYWASLQASIQGIKPFLPNSTPVVIPPVVVGSVD
jgi:hypothetical protein